MAEHDGELTFDWEVQLWPSPTDDGAAEGRVQALMRAASSADGLVRVARQDGTGDDLAPFVTVRLGFANRSDVDAWDPVARDHLTGSSAPWRRPPAVRRVDAAASPEVSESVTAEVEPDRVPEYLGLRAEVTRLVVAAPGFVGISSRPAGGGSNEWITEITFSDEASLRTWQSDPQRRQLVDRLRALAPERVTLVPAGFGRWIATTDGAIATTPVWKSSMVVVAVLYALVSVLNMTLGDSLSGGWRIGEWSQTGLGLPFPVVVFIGNLVGTIILAWPLMPLATRAMRWFLDPGASPRATRWGVVLLVGVYLVEIAVFVGVYSAVGI